jgi:hypothetical protein
MNYIEGLRILRVSIELEPIRREWANACYAATMPGNIDAYCAAVYGCLF